MAAVNFKFESKGIGKLLKDGNLAVPPNQRSYAWGDTHVKDLLQDLNEAITNDDSDYFLGTIVLVQKDNEIPSIADGQQRLATATILLARIRDYLHSLSRERSANSVDTEFLRHVDRETEALSPRLQLNTEDHDFFVRGVLAAPYDSNVENIIASRQSNKLLQAASELASEFLSDMLKTLRRESHPERLLKWVSFIENKASIVVVTVQDEVGAFRIFETLNDRGLRASQADILKNFFFSKSGARLSEAQMMWNTIATGLESLEENTGDLLVTYIRHHWITKHGPTKERELAAKIKAEIAGETKAMQFLSEGSSFVQTYLALWSSKHVHWINYSPSVRRNIEIISEHLQVKQIRPLLFAVALHFDPAEAEKALRLFVSWSVRFLIYGGRGGMLDEQYSRRAEDVGVGRITKARELREAMKKYVPSDAQFEEAFSTARVSRPHLARYYLRAIENTRTADPQPEYVANDDVQDITLEHILPLTPSTEWAVDDEIADAAQKLIGNMVLLKANQNRDAGNGSFASKKAIYSSSGYYTTKEIADYGTWTMNDIRDRQTKLAKLALRTWPLDYTD